MGAAAADLGAWRSLLSPTGLPCFPPLWGAHEPFGAGLACTWPFWMGLCCHRKGHSLLAPASQRRRGGSKQPGRPPEVTPGVPGPRIRVCPPTALQTPPSVPKSPDLPDLTLQAPLSGPDDLLSNKTKKPHAAKRENAALPPQSCTPAPQNRGPGGPTPHGSTLPEPSSPHWAVPGGRGLWEVGGRQAPCMVPDLNLDGPPAPQAARGPGDLDASAGRDAVGGADCVGGGSAVPPAARLHMQTR